MDSSTNWAVIYEGEAGEKRSQNPAGIGFNSKLFSLEIWMHLQKLSFTWPPHHIPACRNPRRAYSHPSPSHLYSASFPSPFLEIMKLSRGLTQLPPSGFIIPPSFLGAPARGTAEWSCKPCYSRHIKWGGMSMSCWHLWTLRGSLLSPTPFGFREETNKCLFLFPLRK